MMFVYYYYFPMALAVIFFVIGLFVYQRRKGRKEVKSRPFNVRQFLAIVFIVVGAVLAAWMILFSPSPSKRHTLIQGALHSPVADIVEISIKPYPEANHPSLTTIPIIVSNRQDIAKIADLLDHAIPFSPNHPIEKWSAWVTIKTKKTEYNFILTQATDATNGTIIYLSSDLTEGWTIGTFRSDQLGKEIEQLAQSTNQHGKGAE